MAGRWIERWDPEDDTFWRETGERVARRNLFLSVFCEHIGFSVWSLWSVMVLFMGPGYGVDPAGKFFLISVATLVGALVRIPYTFAVARFGGRNWSVISACCSCSRPAPLGSPWSPAPRTPRSSSSRPSPGSAGATSPPR